MGSLAVQSYGPFFVGLVILIAGVCPPLVFGSLLLAKIGSLLICSQIIVNTISVISYVVFPKVCFFQLL